jgi:hypothetical protein
MAHERKDKMNSGKIICLAYFAGNPTGGVEAWPKIEVG